MIGIGIAATIEWEAVLKYYDIKENEIKEYPFGFYFNKIINEKECIFYSYIGYYFDSNNPYKLFIFG